MDHLENRALGLTVRSRLVLYKSATSLTTLQKFLGSAISLGTHISVRHCNLEFLGKLVPKGTSGTLSRGKMNSSSSTPHLSFGQVSHKLTWGSEAAHRSRDFSGDYLQCVFKQ